MAKQLLGKPVADRLKERLSAEIEKRRRMGKALGFAAVRVGDDPSSVVYQGRLVKAAATLGFEPLEIALPEGSSETEVIEKLKALGEDEKIAGILLFMPLPKGLDKDRISRAIPIEKDVDALNPVQFGDVMAGRSPWAPCTARAVMEMADYYEYDLTGKHVVIIGRSDVVGRPLAQLMLARNATVTVCHSRTKDLALHTRSADLVVPAVGQAGILTGDMLKPGAWVIDVGINVRPDGQGITGDADFASCEPICEAISPVPGGVGAISVTMVLEALLREQD